MTRSAICGGVFPLEARELSRCPMNRITACLITLDEEDNLPRALRSLEGIADEIVVVDSGSRDRTREIAAGFGARVIARAWSGYADQKNLAAAAAEHGWILSLDADEELSPELRISLLDWKRREPEGAVYEFARRACYLGAWIRHSGWYPDYKRRLYRRDAAQFSGMVHESLRFEGKAGRLRGDLLHYPIHSPAQHGEKVERYSTLAARQLYDAGCRHGFAGMWLAAPWAWFRSYVLHAGFLDGARGMRISRMAARFVRMKYRKLSQLAALEKKKELGRQ